MQNAYIVTVEFFLFSISRGRGLLDGRMGREMALYIQTVYNFSILLKKERIVV